MIRSIDRSELSVQVIVTLGHFLWQACLIAAALVFVERFVVAVGRRRSHFDDTASHVSRIRYASACLALLSLPICIAATFGWVHQLRGSVLLSVNEPVQLSKPTLNMKPVIDADAATVSAVPALPPAGTPIPVDAPAQASSASFPTSEVVSISWNEHFRACAPFLLISYLTGVVLMLGRFGLAMFGSVRLRQTLEPITDEPLLRIIRRQSEKVGLRCTPVVALCRRVSAPVVVGILKPMILLPPSLVCGLDPNQLAAILGHEMAHIRRYDLWVNFAQRTIEALLFFHPVTWWLSRRVSIERENCCDDLAAQGCGRLEYVDALLRMAEHCASARGPKLARSVSVLAADGGNPSQLGYRIQRLLGEQSAPRVSLSRGVLVMLTTAVLLGGISVAVMAQSAGETAPATSHEQATKSPMVQPPAKDGVWITAPQTCQGKAYSTSAKAANWKQMLERDKRFLLASAQDKPMEAGVLPYHGGNFGIDLTVQLQGDATCRLSVGEAQFDMSKSEAGTQLVFVGKDHNVSLDPDSGDWIPLRVTRRDGKTVVEINGEQVGDLGKKLQSVKRISVKPIRGTVALKHFVVRGEIYKRKDIDGTTMNESTEGDHRLEAAHPHRPVQETFRLPEHRWVHGLTVSPDSRSLFSLARDHASDHGGSRVTIRTWSFANQALTGEVELEWQQEWTRYAGSLLLSQDGGKVVALVSGEIVLWNAANGKIVHRHEIPEDISQDKSYAVALSHLIGTPDLSRIAFGRSVSLGGLLPSAHAIVMDTRVGRVIQKVKMEARLHVQSLAISSDGKHLATVGSQCGASIWDVESGKLLLDFKNENPNRRHPDPKVNTTSTKLVSGVTFSPDGRTLAVSDMLGIKLVDVARGKVLKQMDVPYRYHSGNPNLVFSADGNLFASLGTYPEKGLPRHISLFSANDGKRLMTLTIDPRVAAFSPDGKWFASGKSDLKEALAVWKIRPDNKETESSPSPENAGLKKQTPDRQHEPANRDMSGSSKDADKPNATASKAKTTTNRWWSAFGQVTDGEGKPLRGVTIRAATGWGTLVGGGTTITDARGRYRLNFGPGILVGDISDDDPSPQTQSALFYASLPGHFEKNSCRHGNGIASLMPIPKEQLKQWSVAPDQVCLPGKPREINFVMLPASSVRGTLIGEDDRPLVDYSVSLTAEKLPPGSLVVAQVRTDAKGRFSIESIPTSQPCQFVVRKPRAQLKPPWNDSWASGPIQFVDPAEHDFATPVSNIVAEPPTLMVRSFRLRVVGPGVHDKKAIAAKAVTCTTGCRCGIQQRRRHSESTYTDIEQPSTLTVGGALFVGCNNRKGDAALMPAPDEALVTGIVIVGQHGRFGSRRCSISNVNTKLPLAGRRINSGRCETLVDRACGNGRWLTRDQSQLNRLLEMGDV